MLPDVAPAPAILDTRTTSWVVEHDYGVIEAPSQALVQKLHARTRVRFDRVVIAEEM